MNSVLHHDYIIDIVSSLDFDSSAAGRLFDDCYRVGNA